MNELVYPRERTLGIITLVLGLLTWVALIAGTFGVALLGLLLGFVVYLFTHSALVAHLRGNGVQITADQFPDLHDQFVTCCDKLSIHPRPQAYVLNGNGTLNAFATKFLGAQFVVLLSDVVDAMAQHPGGLRFYIGHELGHLRMKHLRGQLLRWPVLWLPLLGAAYSRARESTCDRHGLACCDSPQVAAQALTALSAGPMRWRQIIPSVYAKQVDYSSGFWMSFHELISGYPWLTKRARRVLNKDDLLPRRHPWSYPLALFVPFGGRLGSGFSFLMMIYIVGVLAAVAIPAYHDYTVRAQLADVIPEVRPSLKAMMDYLGDNNHPPDSLEQAHIPARLIDGSELRLTPGRMVLTVVTPSWELSFVPSTNSQGDIVWTCVNGRGLQPMQLPPECRQGFVN